jgi:hypothetical protein
MKPRGARGMRHMLLASAARSTRRVAADMPTARRSATESVMLNETSGHPAPVVPFLHLPKTAGETLNRMVYQKLGS